MTKLFKYIEKKFKSILEDYMNTELEVRGSEDNRGEVAKMAYSHFQSAKYPHRGLSICASLHEEDLLESSVIDEVADYYVDNNRED